MRASAFAARLVQISKNVGLYRYLLPHFGFPHRFELNFNPKKPNQLVEPYALNFDTRSLLPSSHSEALSAVH